MLSRTKYIIPKINCDRVCHCIGNNVTFLYRNCQSVSVETESHRLYDTNPLCALKYRMVFSALLRKHGCTCPAAGKERGVEVERGREGGPSALPVCLSRSQLWYSESSESMLFTAAHKHLDLCIISHWQDYIIRLHATERPWPHYETARSPFLIAWSAAAHSEASQFNW